MHEPFGEKRFIHDVNLSGYAIYASRTDEFFLNKKESAYLLRNDPGVSGVKIINI